MDKNNIAVLIPAHNEAQSIGVLIREIIKIIPTVFVIDDGSTDNTADIARANGAFVIRHSQCMGKGAALQTAFEHLKNLPFSIYITMDGDGQHMPSDIYSFLQELENNKKVGIIVGKRRIKGTNMPFIRRLTNISMSFLTSLLAFQWIPDSQNGFRAIKKDVIKDMNLISSHFETETEILLRAAWKGVKISSVCVSTVYKKEKSKIKPINDTKKFFLMLLKLCISYGRKT
ncbi:MAG TPA: glycosyltransferase family 2 protein [bacterium]|nr:glycosyltransferase family 2 protein [bacterium]